MEETIYHYRICTDENGTPEEVSRSGAAINYKAVDTRTGQPVVLQLIPLAAIDASKREQFEQRAQAVRKLDHVNIANVQDLGVDQERFVFVSEYLQGETADSWVIAHGPLAPDAVLRVALQVVRAIAAAAFHGLTHRAIQPANLLIVPGPAPEGGWPFVKLLNFDVAGVELHSASGEARELAPALPPQFASPEQLRGGEIDFRSEMYSLGATMCFLLAGAVPLAVGSKSVRARLRSLPELRRAPRRVRKLLAQMLHENPEMRPQDPVALEKQIQKALGDAPAREQVVRSLTPVAPILPERPAPGTAPLAQVWRGAIAFVALLLVGGVAASFIFPKVMPWHRSAKIGKPVGVPEAAASPAQNIAATTVSQPPPPSAPLPSAAQQPTPPEERQQQTSTAVAAVSERTSKAGPENSSQAAASERHDSAAEAEPVREPAAPESAPSAVSHAIAETSTPAPPTVQPRETAPPAEAATDAAKSERRTAANERKTSAPDAEERPATTHRADSPKKKSRVAKLEEKPRKAIPLDPALAAEEDEAIRRAGQVRAQFAGTTADGRLMLRLPSGQIVTVRPRDEQEHALEPRRHRRATEPQDYPRAEPLNPDEEPQY